MEREHEFQRLSEYLGRDPSGELWRDTGSHEPLFQLEARENVLDVQGCVVGEIQAIARAIRRVDVNGQEYVRSCFSDLQTETLYVFR